MILSQPEETRFDLRFTLFGTPIRIHPLFWLMVVIFGQNFVINPPFSDNGMPELLIWVAAVLVSIILHEFGHVWMWRVFGTRATILLHSMGGLAIPEGYTSQRHWQSILVSFAGPAIQLVLAALLWWVTLTYGRNVSNYPALTFLLRVLLWINLYWALFNLLPIFPLDGGWIARHALQMVSTRQGLIVSLWISIITCVVIAANIIMPHVGREAFIPRAYFPVDSPWVLIMCVLLVVTAFQELRKAMSYRPGPFDDDW